MNVQIEKDHVAMSREAANYIIKVMQENPQGLYCFAGGDTPVVTLSFLVEAHNEKQIDLTKAHYIELDEWVGLDETNAGSCAAYLHEHLFQPSGVSAEQIHLFDAKSADLVGECEKANQYIEQKGGLTLCLLGVGVNGHLGFNEPGVDFQTAAHIVDLDESTQQVGKKYFAENAENVNRTQGITLGIKQLLEAKHIVVVASGTTKKAAIEKLLDPTTEKTAEWPVTCVKDQKNSVVFLDEAAATK